MGGRSPSQCWGRGEERCTEKQGAAYYASREPPPRGGRGRGVLRVSRAYAAGWAGPRRTTCIVSSRDWTGGALATREAEAVTQCGKALTALAEVEVLAYYSAVFFLQRPLGGPRTL
ncbi:hypothetical protein J1605_002944 [Eschrichtius robustus]|uniref:Uncharacterized protein n=1 Tax=Eschrichtius robustus TaxID=9764 RepID=A0AB34HWF8_ESCRO|nr:hypothetical protein J1605_002944 [Eschrichtius robustus]